MLRAWGSTSSSWAAEQRGASSRRGSARTPTAASAWSRRARTTAHSQTGAGPTTFSIRAHLCDSHDWGAGGRRRALARRAHPRRVVRAQRLHGDRWALPPTTTSGDPAGRTPSSDRTSIVPGRSCGRPPRTPTGPSRSTRPSSRARMQLGLPALDDLNDPDRPVGAGAVPRERRRRTPLERGPRVPRPGTRDGRTSRSRPTLSSIGWSSPAARVRGVVAADGRRFEAATVVLRCGRLLLACDPHAERHRPRGRASALSGYPSSADLPVGSGCSTTAASGVAWALSPGLRDEARERAATGTASSGRTRSLKAASSRCPDGAWDLHLLSWIYAGRDAVGSRPSVAVFHMKPSSTGRVRLRSRDPRELPLVERGFLLDPDDLQPILEGVELARRLAATAPLTTLLDGELTPGRDRSRGVRAANDPQLLPPGRYVPVRRGRRLRVPSARRRRACASPTRR